jgi:predicted nucleic acid-binding protein
MAVVSDTNILSSLAVADGLALLPKLFYNDTIYIPPAVEQELRMGLTYGKTYLERVLQALQTDDIQVLELTDEERNLTVILSARLNAGEREGIVLCRMRKHLFLSNDTRAVRYCQANHIDAISLEILLRLL